MHPKPVIERSKEELLREINALDEEESWKVLFRKIAETKLIKMTLGTPAFETQDVNLMPLKSGFGKTKLFSLRAFFFTFLTYLVQGMWKKGLTLFGIGIGLFIVLIILHLDKLLLPVNLVYACWVGMMAKYDYYRYKVLKEDFWF
jgi:hypothetical protein